MLLYPVSGICSRTLLDSIFDTVGCSSNSARLEHKDQLLYNTFVPTLSVNTFIIEYLEEY
jgi:hypothetical protein